MTCCCIQASLADLCVVDYVAEDPLIKVMNVTKDQVATALAGVGFTDELRVSGGRRGARGLPKETGKADAIRL